MLLTFENPQVREIAERIHALSRDLRLIEELEAPSIRDISAAPVLNDWRLGRRAEPALMGFVEGHPSVRPGPVVTSGVYYLDPIAGYARTLSRWYRLGDPQP
ncbi:hypothetical protein DEVEQU_00092 [Devosia equisanguinis]|uniref:Uncharacterized protein n=2 Tax=Devosia TaxID=46913 RepID=A0A3S4DMN9_9HYPH|nr:MULTISPECIES: DUF6634 family protein [Devosia]MBJ3786996.1 hypothetical protein [Devosia sediminis]VDS02973.1 hypothetical protein DEVEQU_00092 [Devosia equisanguinis]